MPRAKLPRLNGQFLEWLADMRNEHEKGSNYYTVYNRAFNNLKASTKEFATPRELKEIKFLGPKIIAALEKRYALENDDPLPTPPAPKSPTRPLKRAATDIDREPPPRAKRRTVSAAALPTQGPAPQAAPSIEAPAGNNEPFQFWYLDGAKRVRDRVEAETSWLEDGLLRMKVVYPLSQSKHALVAELEERERRGDTIVAKMREDTADAFPQCPGFQEATIPAPARPSSSSLAALLDQELQQKRLRNTVDPSRQLPAYLKDINAVASGSRNNANTVCIADFSGSGEVVLGLPSSSETRSLAAGLPKNLVACSSTSEPSPCPRGHHYRSILLRSIYSASNNICPCPPATPHTRPRLSHAVPALPPVEHPSLYTQMTFPDFDARVWKGGEYTVHLVLDTSEKSGKNHEAIGEALGKALCESGVSVERRQLKLGDVAWMAKGRNGEEWMLDVVLERKRLDDLVGSIKDGRFHEQKFRLHRSGISRVLYLVEAYDVNRQTEVFGSGISTAVSSTQVVDGFMVKETKNIKHTIAYLAGLTEELTRAHKTTDLHLVPTALVRPHSYMDLQKHLRKTKPGKCYVTSYADYQTLNHKSGFTTVRDTWTRMLLCVRGMSPEKVGAVVERWDTPRALWEAFRAAQMEEQDARAREAAAEEAVAAGPGKGKGRKKKSTVPEAKMMLQGVGGAEGGMRAIGPTLSGKLYDLLMAMDYDD
ncbi:hypothetical protein DFH09DRAFT_1326027 [Mycena vulgaris]|nr:hypothetical protein DFH09DRAFT_1326027 [Mycena vulgaris]